MRGISQFTDDRQLHCQRSARRRPWVAAARRPRLSGRSPLSSDIRIYRAANCVVDSSLGDLLDSSDAGRFGRFRNLDLFVDVRAELREALA